MGNWLLLHRRSLLVLLGLLVLGGIAAAFRLPVALFPTIDFPRVVVNVGAGDRPVERMAVEVTQPLEQALRAVPEAQAIRSTTTRGSTDLSLIFDWNTDMVTALLQVQAAINQALPDLPAGTRFLARRMDPTVFPMLGFALTSTGSDLIALRDFAYYRLRPLLSAVLGVAEVEVLGGRQAEFQVLVDPARLHAVDLTQADVVQALSGANVLSAVGKLEDQYHLYLTLSDTRLHDEADIEHTILRSGANGVVELEDIARVEKAELPEWTRVNANGHDAVLVNIIQQRGANTIRIAEETKRVVAALVPIMPTGLQIKPYYDQSELVNAAAASVFDAILVGAGLAGLVLWLFLRNLRITLIIAIALPSVLVATVLLLIPFHQSFNIMTLGGMAAAVGLVTDDAVVMTEHIMRRLSEPSKDTPDHGPVMAAALEMAKPLTGSSLATTIVFLPLAFLNGVTGGFFKALALTMAASLMISFFVAFLAVPLLADRWLTRRHAAHLESVGPGLALLHHHYGGLMRRWLSRPLWALPVMVILAVIGYGAYAQVGSGFMPRMDEGGFILDYKAKPGTSLTETDRLLRQVEAIIVATPEIESYSRRTGLSLGGHITETNEGDYFIHLKPLPRRDVETIMADLRETVETRVPGLRVETAQLMEDLIGDLTAVPQPIEIKLFGDDSEVLRRLSPQVATILESIPGVVEVFDGITIAGDAVEIQVDRIKASLEGLNPDAVTRQVQDLLAGSVASHVQVGEKMIGVRVWTDPSLRDRLASIDEFRVRAPDGHAFPLKRVAKTAIHEGQAQVARENLKPMVAVTARLEGRDLGSAMEDVRSRLRSFSLPEGVYVEFGGLYQEQQKSFHDLLAVFSSAVLLVAVLLLFLYERFAIVLAILSTTLLSMSGVFVGLWLTGTELNISSMMGMTMIVGMVTEVAIFYFAELDKTVWHDSEVLVRAGTLRMRPILMTSAIAMLALAPLALGLGSGSAMQKPLAIAIISGLALAVPLVLLLMPVIYALLNRMFLRPGRDQLV